MPEFIQSEKIIKHILDVSYEHLSPKTIEAVKKSILDTVGCNIAGSSHPLGQLIVKIVKEWEGRNESTILVESAKVPMQEAAFANAIMARCVELDDVHEGNPELGGGHGGHVSVNIVPACLALMESFDIPVSGPNLILAIATGADLLVRMRLAAGDAGRIGWMTETIAPFGVVAAGSKLLGLDFNTTMNAFGTAYAFCSGNNLSMNDGTWDVFLASGNSSRGGLLSLKLATRGHLGSHSPLAGRCGLYNLYFRDTFNDNAFSNLGKEFEISNVSIKNYSSCRFTHNAVFTVLDLMKRHNFSADQMERIEISVSEYVMKLGVLDEKGEIKYHPRNLADAQTSIPFCIGVAIIKGDLFPNILTEETVKEAEILDVSRKIMVTVDPQITEQMRKEGSAPSEVRIALNDGRCFWGAHRFIKGHPRNPMELEECKNKFLRCTELSERRLEMAKIDHFIDQVSNLEEIKDVRKLILDLF
jgi:2-methylcitrate dehydratase PrpD